MQAAMEAASAMDSLPHMPQLPNNQQAERTTLGSVLMDRDAIVPIAAWLTPEHFYNVKHGWIYEAALACYHRRTPPDITTVADALKRKGRLEEIGGVPFLIDLISSTPTSYHVEYHARIVERTAVLRRLFQAGGKIAQLGMKDVDDVALVLDQAEQELFAVSEKRRTTDFVAVAHVGDQYIEHLDAVQTGEKLGHGIPTGYIDYDRMTGGLHNSDLLILAARPGVGKSSFAMSIAFNIAKDQAAAVGVFSLEMGKEQLFQRLLATHTGIDSQRIRSGRINQDEIQVVVNAVNYIGGLPIYIDDTAGITAHELRSKARKLQAEHGLDVLIVDYLQLMSGSGKNDNRVQEVSEISRSLKNLARELNIPVIALSQLSRAVEGRTSHVPVLADLRESGSIEQDADQVMFIYREEMYDKDTDKKGIAEIHIAKHRNGPLGVVSLYFDSRTTRFKNLDTYHTPEGY